MLHVVRAHAVAAPIRLAVVESTLSMVGQEQHNGLFLFKTLQNGVGHIVAVAYGIVIVGQNVALPGRKVRAAVVVAFEAVPTLGDAVGKLDVLANQVENGQITLRHPLAERVVVIQKAFVIRMCGGIAAVKLCAAQHRVHQQSRVKQRSRILGRMEYILVGYERHVVASQPHYRCHQRRRGPTAAVAHTVEREQVLQGLCREVPWRHHIVQHHQIPLATAFLGAWACGLPVAVER